MEMFDLTIIWAGIIGFGLMMYVLMDGFDLGLGILYPFAPDEDARDVMMNSVAPVWDGNETWLVLAAIERFFIQNTEDKCTTDETVECDFRPYKKLLMDAKQM